MFALWIEVQSYASLTNSCKICPQLSASALEAVLKTVKGDGLPDMHSRVAMREARDLENRKPGTYGPILQYVEVHNASGNTKTSAYCEPFCFIAC